LSGATEKKINGLLTSSSFNFSAATTFGARLRTVRIFELVFSLSGQRKDFLGIQNNAYAGDPQAAA
jgi:hypothetical protein